MADPEELTIIVHGGRGLKGKKPGRHKFSVIFGLGPTKFRTEVVKEPSGDPDWNEETVVPVSDILDQVFFIVTEKDDIIGQLNIPVTSLRAAKGPVKRSLQPHKKCPKPQGELIYQCYVTKFRAEGDHTHVPIIKATTPSENARPASAFKRLRQRMASPSATRKQKTLAPPNKDKHRGSMSTFNKKLSKSITDLFSFGKMHGSENTEVENTESRNNSVNKEKGRTRRFSLGNFLSVGTDLDTAGRGEDPVIVSVTPSRGPIDQPTRLCIEGRNLGVGKSDIMSLKVAGCDCTDTIEFDSTSRIYCTTHFWKVGGGPVAIDTISGGIGILKNGFTFYEEGADVDANGNNTVNGSTNPFHGDKDDTAGDSQGIDLSFGGKEITSGYNTVPRMRTSLVEQTKTEHSIPVDVTPPTRYKKKHTRHVSESVVSLNNQTPIEHVSKEELQAKIIRLQEENAVLKKDNVDMKSYIDRIVSKCMIHCPEALAQDDDEKTKLYVL